MRADCGPTGQRYRISAVVNDGYKSRKFWLAVGSLMITAIALFTDHVSGAEWITAVTLATGIFATGNVMEKRS